MQALSVCAQVVTTKTPSIDICELSAEEIVFDLPDVFKDMRGEDNKLNYTTVTSPRSCLSTPCCRRSGVWCNVRNMDFRSFSWQALCHRRLKKKYMAGDVDNDNRRKTNDSAFFDSKEGRHVKQI